jgi:hypothetical protein
MTTSDQPPRKAEDRYLRQTLSDPANLRDFLQQETEPVRWEKLLSAVLTFILAHRYRAEYAELKDLAIQAHPVREQEVKVMIDTVAHDLLKEGEARGELRAFRKVLRHMLARRFDPLPEAMLQRIEAATDVARLEAAIDCADKIKSLDELDLG